MRSVDDRFLGMEGNDRSDIGEGKGPEEKSETAEGDCTL